jgi:hypothetical protein
MDKEESEIAADYKAGQMEKKTGEEDFVEYYLDHNSENDIDGEDIVLTDEERRERVEERNISTDSCIDDIFAEIDSSVRKVVLSSHSPPSSPGRYEASAGEKSTAEHSQGEEKDEEEAPLSPASFRKRKPGKLLMLSTHGTANLEKQTQQTIYYVTGAGLHEALALMKTIRPKGVQLTSDEVASRDAMLRANMSFVTAALAVSQYTGRTAEPGNSFLTDTTAINRLSCDLAKPSAVRPSRVRAYNQPATGGTDAREAI